MILKNLAPICLFTYNRLKETKKTVQSLKKNFLANCSEIYIFSDGPKNSNDLIKIKSVRKYINSINGFKKIEILESQENMGLKRSIRTGITQILQKNNKVIVLEDDLMVATNFLEYMNQSLNFYEDYDNIMSISGYSFPSFFKFSIGHNDVYKYPRFFSWGWGTWKSTWNQINWDLNFYQKKLKSDNKFRLKLNMGGQDQIRMLKNTIKGKLSSWAIIYSSHLALYNGYSIAPKTSKVINIGFSEDATHTKFSDRILYQTTIDKSNKKTFNFTDKVNYFLIIDIWFVRYSNMVRAILYLFNKF